MDNENNYGYDKDKKDSSAEYDHGGTYRYDFDLNEQKEEQPAQPGGFALASLVLGILSLVLCCCCYVSIPLAALGILFAILSRSASPMSGRARTGLILSIVGLCLTFFLTLAAMFSLVRNTDMQHQFRDYLEYYMGDDYPEEYFDEDYPDYDYPDRYYDDILPRPSYDDYNTFL